MTHLIDKDALVAEIEKRGNICKKVVLDLITKENKDYYQGKAEAYKETLDFLDTLKVKEVEFKDVKSVFEGQYLSKDKVVTTIERLQDECEEQADNNGVELLEKLFNKLDTLEVKEVDLDNELDFVKDAYYYFTSDERSSMKKVAKHFFELGMQAKEGNTLAKAKGFLVRDKDDYTAIYSTKPEKGKTEWVDGNHPRNANESSCLFTMDARLFPNVEFNDEPIEVEVTITKKGE